MSAPPPGEPVEEASPLRAPVHASPAMRRVYICLGWTSLAVGAVGAVLPLLPTVPFVILAAFLFAKSSPELERRLLEHRHFGHHIVAWRERGAIPKRGKVAALAGLTGSAAMGLYFLDGWPSYVPSAVAVICGGWILSRPNA